MSETFRKILGGSVSARLYDSISAIVGANDLLASNQINQFKEVIKLTLMAKEAGIPVPEFLNIISAFRQERIALGSGEIEMAGSASTGHESTEGNSLRLDLSAEGGLAGFGIKAGFGYETHESSSDFERSSQNFRILARWAVAPANLSVELQKTLVDFVAKQTPGADIPGMPEEFRSPTLDAIKDILPVIKDMFADKTDPQG
jgi:hypothetical protein